MNDAEIQKKKAVLETEFTALRLQGITPYETARDLAKSFAATLDMDTQDALKEKHGQKGTGIYCAILELALKNEAENHRARNFGSFGDPDVVDLFPTPDLAAGPIAEIHRPNVNNSKPHA